MFAQRMVKRNFWSPITATIGALIGNADNSSLCTHTEDTYPDYFPNQFLDG